MHDHGWRVLMLDAVYWLMLLVWAAIALVMAVKIVHASPDVRLAYACFFRGERTGGLNKICFYDCLGSPAAITVRAYELCPLTIEARG